MFITNTTIYSNMGAQSQPAIANTYTVPLDVNVFWKVIKSSESNTYNGFLWSDDHKKSETSKFYTINAIRLDLKRWISTNSQQIQSIASNVPSITYRAAHGADLVLD